MSICMSCHYQQGCLKLKQDIKQGTYIVNTHVDENTSGLCGKCDEEPYKSVISKFALNPRRHAC